MEKKSVKKSAIAEGMQKAEEKVLTIKLDKPFKVTSTTLGQRAADWLTKWAGSWTFIILVGIFIAIWIYLNVTAYVNQWDPWPFIILNLVLSCLAAIQAPIILMSQNREAQKDRIKAEYDHKVNLNSLKGVDELKKQLTRIERRLSKIKTK